jgi:hypothetical protein
MLARCIRGCEQLSARSATTTRSCAGSRRLSARAPAAPGRIPRRGSGAVRAADSDAEQPAPVGSVGASKKPLLDGLGLSLGPVAMTYEGSSSTIDKSAASRLANATGVTLGPIALSLGESAVRERDGAEETHDDAEAVRLNALTSEEWRKAHLSDGSLRGCCAALLLPLCGWQH